MQPLIRRLARVLHLAATVSLFPMASGTAFAQAGGLDPGTLLRDEALRRERQDRLSAPAESGFVAPPVPGLHALPSEVEESGPVVERARITVVSPAADRLPDLSSLIERYQQVPLGEQRLQLLLRQINARLVQAGLVTGRAVLREVDPEQRSLRIEIVPGHVEALTERGAALPERLRHALPLSEGDWLKLADLEQGIHQINRLRLYRAQANILPGQTPGGNIIDLELQTGSWWASRIEFDNLGSRRTGSGRLRGEINLDDRLGWLEAIGLTSLLSEHSEALLGSISVPQGYSTWSATVHASRYRFTLFGDRHRGNSRGLTLGWNRVLHLAAEGRDHLDLTLNRTAGYREIEQTALSPDHVAVVRAAFSRVRREPRLQWLTEAALGVGIDAFGATSDASGLRRSDIHRQFAKLEGHAGLVWQPAAQTSTYALQAAAQYARVALHASEQLRQGGFAAVRGVREDQRFVDRGLLVRHELRFPSLGERSDALAAWSPYLLLDHARGSVVGGAWQSLSSVGAGLRWTAARASSELVVARPIDYPAELGRRHARLHFTFTLPL